MAAPGPAAPEAVTTVRAGPHAPRQLLNKMYKIKDLNRRRRKTRSLGLTRGNAGYDVALVELPASPIGSILNGTLRNGVGAKHPLNAQCRSLERNRPAAAPPPPDNQLLGELPMEGYSCSLVALGAPPAR